MQKAKLTEGRIGMSLFKMSVPMFFGMIGFALFNFFDSKFVGQLGTDALAAISFTVNTMLIMFALAFGLGTGVTACIAKAIGEGDDLKVKRLTTDGLLLGVALGTLLVMVGYPTIKPLFELFGASEDLMPYIFDYMELWYLGVPLIIIPIIGNSAMRAQGNMIIPFLIMLVSIVTNIVLDYGLILGNLGMPRLEVFGASLATFISRFSTLIAALFILHIKFRMISFKGFSVTGMFRSWSEILKIGLPSILTQLIIPIAVASVLKYASGFENGKQLVSTLQTSSRVDFFAIAVIAALGSVLIPFVAQNLGAGKYDRIKEALKISRIFTIIWGLLMTLIFILIRDDIGPVFMKDKPDLIFFQYMSEYYWVVPLSFIFRMIFVVETSAINALQKPIFSGLLMLGQMILLYIPLAYCLGEMYDYKGIYYAYVIATIVGGIASYFMQRKLLGGIISQSRF